MLLTVLVTIAPSILKRRSDLDRCAEMRCEIALRFVEDVEIRIIDSSKKGLDD